MRYIALATDAAPTYAVWAPVVARIWARYHGHQPLVLCNDAGANPAFWAIVLRELTAAGAIITMMPQTGRLTIANTMRCARLVATALPTLRDDDFVLTSDVDMVPIQRTFFDRHESFVVLRAMFQVWLASQVVPPVINLANIRPGEFRFSMCYAGAMVPIWRETFSIEVGNPIGSLARLVNRPNAVDDPGLGVHATDLDETLLSYGFLSSPRAQGPVVCLDTAGMWRKGELVLIDPLTSPLLSSYHNMPRGMLRLNDYWLPTNGTPPPADAIDYIPFRFYPGSQPWTGFDVVAAYFPQERQWLADYRAQLVPVLPPVRASDE